MCGIVGSIGSTESANHVLEGLKRLEYRGYDSSGIATVNNNSMELRRSKGKLASLEEKMNNQPFSFHGNASIGHTRWATHGEANETNSHPHATDLCAVVHNGIIENFVKLREDLKSEGFSFKSETDTETLPVLISKYLSQGKTELEAVTETVKQAEGAFAFGVVFKGNDDLIIASRRGAPLAVGFR